MLLVKSREDWAVVQHAQPHAIKPLLPVREGEGVKVFEGLVEGRDPVLLRLRVGDGLDDRPLGVLVVPLQHLVKERERRGERSESRRAARRRRLTSSIPMTAELQVTLHVITGRRMMDGG